MSIFGTRDQDIPDMQVTDEKLVSEKALDQVQHGESQAPETTETVEAKEPVRAEQDANVILPKSSPDAKALEKGLTVIGRLGIKLPSLSQQRAGFKLDKHEASALVGQFPQYKFIEKKKGGDKQTIGL